MTCFCTIHSQMYPVGGYCSYCGPPQTFTTSSPYELPAEYPNTGSPLLIISVGTHYISSNGGNQ